MKDSDKEVKEVNVLESIPKETKLYPNRRKVLESQRIVLEDQLQKGQQSLNTVQQEIRNLVQEHTKVQAKLELLDEIEAKEDEI